MSASRRIQKELTDILNKPEIQKYFKEIHVDDRNIFEWQGLIIPENPPYNKGAFKIQIEFPVEYPFKPPKINIKTKIYHPNVDEKGQICMPIITAENWKPIIKIEQIIQTLVAMIDYPDADHFLRADVAEEYTKNNQTFMKNAEDHTNKYAEKRPQ